jgi:HEAT repeat protein
MKNDQLYRRPSEIRRRRLSWPLVAGALAGLSVLSASVDITGRPTASASPSAESNERLEWPGRLKTLVTRLSAPSAATRMAALTKLESYPLAKIERPFLDLLDDESWEIRVKAAETLVRKKSKRVVDALIEWMNDFETDHRVTAIRLLGETGLKQAVRPIKRALRDFEPKVRVAALRALGKMEATSALTAVLARLDDEDVKVRMAAVTVLGEIPHPRAVISLMGKLSDNAKEVRKKVLVTLGELGDRRAAPAVLRALEDPVNDIRIAAAKALGNMPSAQSEAALIRVLWEGKTFSFRRAAASALARIGTKRCAKSLVKALRNPALRQVAKTNLRILGPKGVPFLVSRLKDPQVSPKEARAIVELLASIGDTRASSVLIQELGGHRVDPKEVVEALQVCGDSTALIPLVRRLVKAPPKLKHAILKALEPIIDQRAVGPIMSLIDSRDMDVRIRVVRLLGRLRTKQALPKLLDYTGSANRELRLAAIRAVGLIGEPTAAATLEKLLASSDRGVRLEASDALGRTAKPESAPDLYGRVEQNTEWTPSIQAAYLRAIGSLLRKKSHLPTLRKLARRAAMVSPEYAIPAMEALQAARQPSAVPLLISLWRRTLPDSHRAKLAGFVGDTGSSKVVSLLVKALRSREDVALAAASAWSLGKVGDPAAVGALHKRFATARHPAVRINIAAALARLARDPSPTKTILWELLRDPNPYVRLNAAMGLARLCRNRCVKKLAGELAETAKQSAGNVHLSRHIVRTLKKLSVKPRVISKVRADLPEPPDSQSRSVRWTHLHHRHSFDWVAFELTDGQGSSQPGKAYLLILANGLTRAGFTTPLGTAREEKVPPGSCSLEFPRAWPKP